MSKEFMKWVFATENMHKNTNGIICPNCSNVGINFQYVGDNKSMLGHVFIWCDKCLNGIHISRTNIPDGVNVLPLDVKSEELIKFVPNYKIISSGD